MALNYRLEVSASLENLAEIREFVTNAASELGLSGKAMFDLLVAVDEAATNIVLHGYRGESGRIEVVVDRCEEGVSVQLVDGAAPFDHRAAGGANLEEPLESRKVGGMGLHLIQTLTEAVSHEALPGGGNRITMIKKIDP